MKLFFMPNFCQPLRVDWIVCYFYNMNRKRRHQVIKRLQADLPRGAPFDLSTLDQFGVSPQLAARYAESGWLVRLGQGVYAFPNDEFGVHKAVMFLQRRVPGLHVGGKSALAVQGSGTTWAAGRHWFYGEMPGTHCQHGSLRDFLPDMSTPACSTGRTPNWPGRRFPPHRACLKGCRCPLRNAPYWSCCTRSA